MFKFADVEEVMDMRRSQLDNDDIAHAYIVHHGRRVTLCVSVCEDFR